MSQISLVQIFVICLKDGLQVPMEFQTPLPASPGFQPHPPKPGLFPSPRTLYFLLTLAICPSWSLIRQCFPLKPGCCLYSSPVQRSAFLWACFESFCRFSCSVAGTPHRIWLVPRFLFSSCLVVIGSLLSL